MQPYVNCCGRVRTNILFLTNQTESASHWHPSPRLYLLLSSVVLSVLRLFSLNRCHCFHMSCHALLITFPRPLWHTWQHMCFHACVHTCLCAIPQPPCPCFPFRGRKNGRNWSERRGWRTLQSRWDHQGLNVTCCNFPLVCMLQYIHTIIFISICIHAFMHICKHKPGSTCVINDGLGLTRIKCDVGVCFR